MNELMIFNDPEWGEIRTLQEGGKALFCRSDVARAERPSGCSSRREKIGGHLEWVSSKSIICPE